MGAGVVRWSPRSGGDCRGAACCTSFCSLDAADPDGQCSALDPSQTCEPWYEVGTAPDGLEDLGGCVVVVDRLRSQDTPTELRTPPTE